jgi:hypothetical protein
LKMGNIYILLVAKGVFINVGKKRVKSFSSPT